MLQDYDDQLDKVDEVEETGTPVDHAFYEDLDTEAADQAPSETTDSQLSDDRSDL